MFQAAAKLGDICVILNSDEWLVKKKGKNFMNMKERSHTLISIKGVIWIWRSVTLADVSQDIIDINNNGFFKNRGLIFAKGGDRNASNTPEQETCESLGIPVIFGLGGNNEQSSSKILARWDELAKD